MQANLPTLLKKERKDRLTRLYCAFAENPTGATERALFKEVIAFARRKLIRLEWEFKGFGTDETFDDWAQEVTIDVWKGLTKFSGEPTSFHGWVHKITYLKRTNARLELAKIKKKKVSLTVQVGKQSNYDKDTTEYEDKAGDVKDNNELYPELNESGVGFHGLLEGMDKRAAAILRVAFAYVNPQADAADRYAALKPFQSTGIDVDYRCFPESAINIFEAFGLKHLDLAILGMLFTKKKIRYKVIAQELGIHSETVTKRLERIQAVLRSNGYRGQIIPPRKSISVFADEPCELLTDEEKSELEEIKKEFAQGERNATA